MWLTYQELGRQMLCPECSWHWEYQDDGVRCPFCAGAIGVPTGEDPPEAQKAIEEASNKA